MDFEIFDERMEDLAKFYNRKISDPVRDRFWARCGKANQADFEAACSSWQDSERSFPTPAALSALVARNAQKRLARAPKDPHLTPADMAIGREMVPHFQARLAGRMDQQTFDAHWVSACLEHGKPEAVKALEEL